MPAIALESKIIQYKFYMILNFLRARSLPPALEQARIDSDARGGLCLEPSKLAGPSFCLWVTSAYGVY